MTRKSQVDCRAAANDDDLNAQAASWLGGTANVRRHGTTGERPVDRFERDERAVLRPLANSPYRRLGLRQAPEPARRHQNLLQAGSDRRRKRDGS